MVATLLFARGKNSYPLASELPATWPLRRHVKKVNRVHQENARHLKQDPNENADKIAIL